MFEVASLTCEVPSVLWGAGSETRLNLTTGYSRPTVHTYMPNFVAIGYQSRRNLGWFILSPSGGEKPQFLPFLEFGI